MTRPFFLAFAAAIFVSATAQAQTEIAVQAGYTPPVELARSAPELDHAGIDGSFTLILQGTHFLSPHWGFEGLWAQQETNFTITPTGGGETALYSLTSEQLMGNAVYQFGAPKARWRPFAFGGAGAAFFRAPDVPGETKLVFSVGGGIKYFMKESLGIKGQVRYKPTRLNDTSSGDFCDAFGFCQASLQQFEMGLGVVVRF